MTAMHVTAAPVLDFFVAGLSQEREVRRRISLEVVRRANTLRDMGLQVGVSRDFQPLVDAPAGVGETTFRIPLVDPDYQSHLEDGSAFWAGCWRDGTLVATTAVRLRHVPTSLREEMESLRFFYDDPARIPADATCRIDAPTARIVSGLVMCSVSVWTAKRESGKGVAECLSQMTKLIGVGLWDPDHLIGFCMPQLVGRFAFHKYGHSTAELGFDLQVPHFRPPETAILLYTSRRDYREQRLGLTGLTSVRVASSGVRVINPGSSEIQAEPSADGHL